MRSLAPMARPGSRGRGRIIALRGRLQSVRPVRLTIRRKIGPHGLDNASGSKETLQLPPDADLAYARAAVSAVLSRDEKDTSMPWENPGTGARGTVTPIASAYTLDGQTCRDFLASFVSGNSQAWLQGEACKQQQGDWEVRRLKPWKRS